MRALTSVAGVQSLRSITARSSSARVLDLHSLARDADDDPDHSARPMFLHPVLNRTIIVKHHPRAGEFESGAERGAIVTKVIFPFDPGDLDLGGQFLLVDDPDLVDQLARHLDWRDIDMGRDLLMLRLIDRLPTLDPFLLHEAFVANKIDVAPCYFRLSVTDKTEMRDFVAHQVETLIGLCFGGMTVSDAQAKRLSELILAEGDSPELAPLRMAMRMESVEFAQAMFCWKAVLYYRWRSRLLGPEIKATHRSITGVELSRFDPDSARFARAAIAQLESMVLDCERRIAEMFRIYDEVFDALTAQRTPEPFRRFLIDGPRLFARLGERMGRLEQLTSYWSHQFPGLRTRQLRPEVIYDGLRNLLSALSLGTPLTEVERDGEKERVWGEGDLEAWSSPPKRRTSRRAAS
ncbi:MAG TPA: hypothetical protein VN814_25365 [Caulobacteraceae bacterium]|nr:hypothetical protein [Caulobacteraceae bacterium]